MNQPCANPLACPSTDNPLANLSAEKPDFRRFYGYKFFPGQSVACVTDNAEDASLCDPPVPTNPPTPVIYTSNAQSCTLDCADGGQETGTAAGGSFVATSQAEADALALAFACQIAQILCDGGTINLFPSTAQTCTGTCQDGSKITFTVLAGSMTGLSQADADAAAFLLACTVAVLLCAVPPSGDGVGGAGPPTIAYFGNAPQSCTTNCEDGSTFSFTVPAGSFVKESRAAADAVALSYACNQVVQQQFCLTALDPNLCQDVFYVSESETNIERPITWEIVSGALPTGLLMFDGTVAGTPMVAGSYTFTLRATAQDGRFVERVSILVVRNITPDFLPDGDTSNPYAVALIGDGFTDPVWTISAGSLPPGITLHPFTGVLSGTATSSGTFAFTVTATEGSAVCDRELSITVASALHPSAFWKLDNANPQLNTDSVSGNLLSVDADAIAIPGVIGNAVAMPDGISGFGVSQTGPEVSYSGNGWSLAFWFKYPFTGVAGPGVGVVIYRFDTAGASSQFYVDFFSGVWAMNFENGGSDGGVLNYGTPGAWNFLSVTYDGVTGLLSFGVNNGGFTAGFCPPGPTVLDPNAIMFCGVEDFAIDELGLYPMTLRPQDITYLFNAGAGRTYPIVFPP